MFRDLNTDYGLNTSPILITELDAIQNKLYNLLRCPKGSRFMQPEFGTNLLQFIHEPCDGVTAHKIRMDFILAIERWMPEILLDLNNTYVVQNPSVTGYYVKLSYSIPLLNTTTSLSFNAVR